MHGGSLTLDTHQTRSSSPNPPPPRPSRQSKEDGKEGDGTESHSHSVQKARCRPESTESLVPTIAFIRFVQREFATFVIAIGETAFAWFVWVGRDFGFGQFAAFVEAIGGGDGRIEDLFGFDDEPG